MDGRVAWVENRHELDLVVATHGTDGVVDNERPICAYPRRAVYTGPGGGETIRLTGWKAIFPASESSVEKAN